VQGFESEEFVALFGGRIKLLAGGIESGFHNVKPEEYKPRLLHIKGKRQVRVTQVPLSSSSLNDGDVFVLDNGLQLYQWNGASAGIFEKRKGGEIVEALKSERNGRPKSKTLDSTDDEEAFWKALGGHGKIAAATPDDEVKADPTKAVYRLSDSSGSLKIDQVYSGVGKIKRTHLKSDDVFLVDIGVQLFVWVGKSSTKQEKASAIPLATEFLKKQGRPVNSIAITRLIEGGENEGFNLHFE